VTKNDCLNTDTELEKSYEHPKRGRKKRIRNTERTNIKFIDIKTVHT